MKKNIVILTVAVMVITLCTVVFADAVKYITAEVSDYTIKLNGKAVEEDISVVTIDGRAYVPVRALGEIADFGVNWNEDESAVEISTGKVETGIPGAEKSFVELDMNISQETAVAIADVAFADYYGEEYFNETKTISVRESDDKKMYLVTRAKTPSDSPKTIVVGGGLTMVIRKSDGKIMQLLANE